MENKVARTYLRRADFERWGLSEGCPGCRCLRTGQGRQQAHSEACRRRIEGLLKGDPSGSTRLAAADERINRALADAVERHAAKDPGVRGILKRASTACHPESESQKKIALDTARLDALPLSLIRRIISIRNETRDADTSEVTIVTGPEVAQGMIQPSSSDDTGGDAVMEGENADERSATDSNPSGPDSRRRVMTKREPREARDEQSTVTRQHVPRRMSGKTTPQGHAVAVTTQEALDEPREKTMRVANIENNSLNWVSISSAGALDMTNCDFSERRARDEMRHIIGSSERDVIIGSDKDRNRGCKKKDKDHIEFLCELYEAQAAQGRYFVHELTSEASSRMKCVVKIMAMPGARAAVADLCMFGLAACDDGGPGFVNASVRTITNARQVGVRLQSKCNSTHRHARVDAEDVIGKREQTGTWVREAARATDEQLKKDKQELEMREQRKRAEDANRICSMINENAENKGLSLVEVEMGKLMHQDEQELLSVWEGWHWDDNKGGWLDLVSRERRHKMTWAMLVPRKGTEFP